jgi:hypothetical protein
MTDAFAGASGADLMRPAVPRFDPLFVGISDSPHGAPFRPR